MNSVTHHAYHRLPSEQQPMVGQQNPEQLLNEDQREYSFFTE